MELPEAEATALDVRAPVNLGTRRIGSVTGTQLRLQDDHTLISDVTIVIDPHLLRIAGAPGGSGDQQTEAILALLVEQGQRAQFGSTTPVVGAKEIDLRFSPGAATSQKPPD